MARIVEWWRYDLCGYCGATVGKRCVDMRIIDARSREKAVPHIGRLKLTPKEAIARGSKPE